MAGHVDDMHPNDIALHDYADGTGEAAERRSIEQHLSTCATCRQLVDDVNEIKRAVGTLEPRDPPVRVWSRIERAIVLERDGGARSVQPIDGGHRTAPATGPGGTSVRSAAASYARWAPWLAAAAALVLVTLVGFRFMPGRNPSAPPASEANVNEAAQSIESELRLAESHYEKAIKGLEEITRSDQQALDPKTAATLQKNLAVIDQAISESRAAVRSQPSNEPAQQSLVENFKTKIALLQDTVALINEMRKGNEAGAARIVSGLKQKG